MGLEQYKEELAETARKIAAPGKEFVREVCSHGGNYADSL